MHKIQSLLFCFAICLTWNFQIALAQDNTSEELMEGKVLEILEESVPDNSEPNIVYQKLKVGITNGSLEGKYITVENGKYDFANPQKYIVGDQLQILKNIGPNGETQYFIADYVRKGSLLLIFLLFLIVVGYVGRWQGIFALIGMALSFAVVFYFVLPRILGGSDPVITVILASLLIIPLTFYTSHGISKKTSIAVGGTLVALLITGVLSLIFVKSSHLTGYASGEASFLEIVTGGSLNLQGILLAGILLGLLGILDDITISQAAIVQELKSANHQFGFRDLYHRSMRIGRDHIASLVNTLILVYTGAALPLLLLFLDDSRSFGEIVNYEIVATEIVRTLIGSIGLILAVPITSFFASGIYAKTLPAHSDGEHSHHHH